MLADMSLAIDVDKVTSVLLADGAWHDVSADTFMCDAYEFIWDAGGGHTDIFQESGHTVGYSFRDHAGVTISGPLTAILAVKRKT